MAIVEASSDRKYGHWGDDPVQCAPLEGTVAASLGTWPQDQGQGMEIGPFLLSFFLFLNFSVLTSLPPRFP